VIIAAFLPHTDADPLHAAGHHAGDAHNEAPHEFIPALRIIPGAAMVSAGSGAVHHYLKKISGKILLVF
jgi:hypothetical protein